MMSIHILIAEHDVSNMETISSHLATKGDVPVTASDGLTAIQRFLYEGIDLAILSITLPYIGACDVIMAIRQLERRTWRRRMPILVLLHDHDRMHLIPCKEAGADGVLVTPLTPRDLDRALDRVLSGGTYWEPVESTH